MYASIILKKVVCLCCKKRWNKKIYRIISKKLCTYTTCKKKKKSVRNVKNKKTSKDITRKIFTPSLAYILVFLPLYLYMIF